MPMDRTITALYRSFLAASRADILLGRVNVKKLAMVSSTGHIWFEVRREGEEGEGEY